MVEVCSYIRPGCGWKLPRWRREDKELGQGYLSELGTTNAVVYMSYFHLMLSDLPSTNISYMTPCVLCIWP